ncbi:MAG: pitrilysin family protein [Candidatus Tantalella remota]|nr:pitrilysin family protein [Candidatus Tantalella remota]
MRTTFKIIAILLLATATASCSIANEAEYQKKVLDNGATVVCRYVPDSSLVTVQLRVLSGLSNEGSFAGSGISHFLEHLLFKNTVDRSSEDIRAYIKSMGGTVNGATGLDSAEYHITVPVEHFEDALELLVDMVFSPVFTEGEMETEKQIVLNEIRLRNDDPATKRWRLLFGEAYGDHVYGQPVIGHEEVFRELSMDDILGYHGNVYTADRMVLGIAGGVPPEKAMLISAREMAKYDGGGKEQIYDLEEPVQDKERVVEHKTDVIVGYMAIGFHTTSIYSPDMYPTDVLSSILGEGSDSILSRRLVDEKKLLYLVSSLNYTPRYPGLFMITGMGAPEDLDAAREEVFSVIREIAGKGVDSRELERAKNLMVSTYLHTHEKVSGIADSMTSSELLMDDPAFFEKYVERVNGVKGEDVRKMAAEYLRRSNSTTVFLLPKFYESSPRAPVVSAEDEEVVAVAGKGRENNEEQARSGLDSARKYTAAQGDVSRTLPNGMRFIVKSRGYLPLVSVTLAVPGGLMQEDALDNGVSNLVVWTMLKGTKTRDQEDIIPEIEHMGGRIDSISGKDMMGISMDLLSGDLDRGIAIISDVARNATFPQEKVDWERTKIISVIGERDKDIFYNGVIRLKKLIYGDHPYGRRETGDIDSVSGLSREELLKFYSERFAPGFAVLTVAGDVDAEKTAEQIVAVFGDWEGKGTPPKEIKVRSLEGSRQENISMDKEQSLFMGGFLGARTDEEDRYTLEVISSLLSGGDGLLFRVAREERGLTYTSGAVSVPAAETGYFLLYVATSEEDLPGAGKAAGEVIREIADGEISDKEINASRKKLIARHAGAIEANSTVSFLMAWGELHGLGYDNYLAYPEKIKAVTREEIIRVAETLLSPDKEAQLIIHSANPGR